MNVEAFIYWCGAASIFVCMSFGAVFIAGLWVNYLWRRLNDIYSYTKLSEIVRKHGDEL